MELSYTSIPDVTPIKMISATSTYGIGLLTSIAMFFCNIFGLECTAYNNKIGKAKISATDELINKAKYAKADGIMQIQYQVSGLTVFMYGIAYKNNTDNIPVQQTAAKPYPKKPTSDIVDQGDYDTWQCKQCGTKNLSFTSVCKNCGGYKG